MKDIVVFSKKLISELAIYNNEERDAIVWHLLRYGLGIDSSMDKYAKYEKAIDNAQELKKAKKYLLEDEQYEYIINHLNEQTGKAYKSTGADNRKWIDKVISAGYTVDDCIAVIDNMSALWGNNDKMERYLRPETLFGNKFASYLNVKVNKKSNSESSSFDTDDFFKVAVNAVYK